MTVRGISPAGLGSLGDLLRTRSVPIMEGAVVAHARLARHEAMSAADRVGTELTTAAYDLRSAANDLQWRIDYVTRVVDSSWRLVGPPSLVSFNPDQLAIAVPFGAGAPLVPPQIDTDWRDSLRNADPLEVSDFFVGLDQETVGLLIVADPDFIGSLDGAPSDARYVANDLLIAAEIRRLRDSIALVERQPVSRPPATAARRSRLADTVGELESWLKEGRQVLLFDTGGDGRVAEVFGDLNQASHVGVVVPGMANDMSNFSIGSGGFRSNARHLHQRACQMQAESVATVAWLGYDTPDGLGALSSAAANDGFGDLVDFVAAINSDGASRHITVLAHSYGSLLTGVAAGKGLPVDDVVFLGSPGTSLQGIDEMLLNDGARVWAALAQTDPIGYGIDTRRLSNFLGQLSEVWERLSHGVGGEFDSPHLHHGPNPAHEDFGAVEIATDGSDGHSQYYDLDTVTLENLVYIVAGLDGRVKI